MTEATTIQCFHCEYKPFNAKDFYNHSNRHRFESGKLRLLCFLCPRTFKTFRSHKQHVQTHSIAVNEVENKENSENVFWQCENCRDTIPVNNVPNPADFDKVTRHIKKHAKTEVVSCPHCEKSFNLYQA